MVTRKNKLDLALAIAKAPRPFSPWAFTDVSPFMSRFEHTDEIATPGVYAVALPDIGTTAKVAVSGTHAGVHTWTCGSGTGSPSGPAAPVAGPCVLIIDVCHRTHDGPCSGANMTVSPLQRLADGTMGWAITATLNNTGDFSASTGGVRLWFYATASLTFLQI